LPFPRQLPPLFDAQTPFFCKTSAKIAFCSTLVFMNNNPRPKKKKALGQHFLRRQSVVDHMIERVKITPETSVMEIGCGDGFLTRAILLQSECTRLWCYEIDHEWATHVTNTVKDKRLKVKRQNILEVDWKSLETKKPWVLLSNLPYQITFPILFLIKQHKDLFEEGVVMVQEEVAQKLVATYGRSYTATSLVLQHHLNFELMEKIDPSAFSPPPKVNSRLVYFKPRKKIVEIEDEEDFWSFIKVAFSSPRRTLRNNLKSAHYDVEKINEKTLSLRAQQISFDEFLKIWKSLNS